MLYFTLFLALLLLGSNGQAQAEDIVYPADSGVLNVKAAPYHAVGDGIHDDTRAIQSALAAGLNNHKLVYLPNGTYLISDTLKWNNGSPANGGWGRFLSMQGESQAGTIIRLKDSDPSFRDTNTPKAVVDTASGDDNNAYSDTNGEGNQGFENSLYNLTVDTGSGNPGATGVDYQVSNWGAMRDVTIRSSDPRHGGCYGINLQRRDNGPGLIKNVTIDGFQCGIIAHQEIVQMTVENVTLRHQSVFGIYDGSAVFAIRKLHSVNAVPAVCVDGDGMLNLIDADLRGGTPSGSAVETVTGDSRALVRNVTTNGYRAAVRNRGRLVPGTSLSEWTSDGVFSTFPSPPATLHLPVRETPTYFDTNLSHWASVGPPSGSDDTAAIQAAMNSGKSVVYFPSGSYQVNTTVTVPATVRLIIGMGTSLGTARDQGISPLFLITGGSGASQTIIARFTESTCHGVFIEDASARTLVLEDIGSFGGDLYRSRSGAGPLFLENIAGGGYHFDYPQQVWARQWNVEGGSGPKVFSSGATLWALGLKTEGTDTEFDLQGGKLELLGGLFYTFGDSGNPAFINNGGAVSLSFAGTTYVSNGFFRTLVREIRAGTTQTFTKSSAYGRGSGASVILYTGYQSAVSTDREDRDAGSPQERAHSGDHGQNQ